MTDLVLRDEVSAIVGAAMAVQTELRAGYLEAVYQEAMQIELEFRGIPLQAQVPLTVHYKGRPLLKTYLADLICYGQVVVELKVIERLTSREEAQLLNYLYATRMRVGVLLNFGDPGRLDWKRMVV
jgi:GxxExxY protein